MRQAADLEELRLDAGDGDVGARDRARELVGLRRAHAHGVAGGAGEDLVAPGRRRACGRGPSTMMWSAVCAISLIRCDERKTVRPSAGEVAGELAHPEHALGVEAVDGLVEDERGRVAEHGRGDAEPLAHAEGEAADALAATDSRPVMPMTSCTRASGMPWVAAMASRWL